MPAEGLIQEFAPTLRVEAQANAFRISLQMLGDSTGFGIGYFDYDNLGYVKTATGVASDNSALLRNIRRHENDLEGALVGISRAVMGMSRALGEGVLDEGGMRVMFDDSIITDTAAEKAQDMREVGMTMAAWGYRSKWYGEEEAVARKCASELGSVGISGGSVDTHPVALGYGWRFQRLAWARETGRAERTPGAWVAGLRTTRVW